jgi:hypothetical protein
MKQSMKQFMTQSMELQITFIFAILLFHSVASFETAATETSTRTHLSDASYLRKLSFHLRGIQPGTDEYSELSATQPGQRQTFFSNKIDQYLSSPHYQDRMMFRLSELFQIQTPSAPPVTGGLGPNRLDSLLDLFGRMARDNLPWDILLIGKDYNAGRVEDIHAFQPIMTNLTEDLVTSSGVQPVPVHFEASDLRVAGALTTARFLSRYNTTNVNKNRRRAAAVFRIFYCDPMSPVVPPPKDKKAAVLAQAFGTSVDHGSVTEKDLKDGITISDAARHGAQTQCATCHYKLDPLGRTFQNFGLTLNSEPAAGALVFARPGGQKVNIPVKGIGELGAEIAKTPEYTACQVEWFWQQLIGQDVFLLPNRKDELSAEFDRLGRRTNDFVRFLVKAPEFRERPKKVDTLTQLHLSPLLKRCDSCHNAMGAIAPFAGTPSQLIEPELLERMRVRMNLPDDDKQKMPRDWTRWNTRDLELLKRWLNGGAHDSTGKQQIMPLASQGEQGDSK